MAINYPEMGATSRILIASGADTLADASTGILAGKAIQADGTPAAAGEVAFGILANETTNGDHGTVYVAPGSIVEVLSGASYSAGVNLAADSAGRLVLATTGDFVIAKAIDAATAANQICSARLVYAQTEVA